MARADVGTQRHDELTVEHCSGCSTGVAKYAPPLRLIDGTCSLTKPALLSDAIFTHFPTSQRIFKDIFIVQNRLTFLFALVASRYDPSLPRYSLVKISLFRQKWSFPSSETASFVKWAPSFDFHLRQMSKCKLLQMKVHPSKR